MSSTQAPGGAGPNPRYLLRAYEHPDAARVAVMIGEASQVSRDVLCERWVARWPEHVHRLGRRNIRQRLGGGLSLLSAAGVVVRAGGEVRVLSVERLAMVQSNAAMLLDGAGFAVPPRRWPRRCAVPAELVGVQAEMERARMGVARPAEGRAGE